MILSKLYKMNDNDELNAQRSPGSVQQAPLETKNKNAQRRLGSVQQAPLETKIKCCNDRFTIRGRSRSGRATCIYIKELKLCFDMGVLHDKWSFNNDTVCISHGHGDHMNSLHIHSRIRRLQRMEKRSNYIMPNYCMNNFNLLYRCVASLDKGMNKLHHFKYDGDHYSLISADCLSQKYNKDKNDENKCEFYLRKNMRIETILLTHKIQNFGYILIEERSKLKEEYSNLSGKEIGDIRKRGINVTDKIDHLLLGYTGDTIIDSVINSDIMMNVDTLIIECTFLDNYVNIETARKRGHIHLDEIITNHKKFNNKQIILMHFSNTYKDNEITTIINNKMKNLPLDFKQKISILL